LRDWDGDIIKTAYAIVVAALVAGFVVFPGLSPWVDASSPIPGAKGDRADIRPLGTDCGEQAWPYFDAACMREAAAPLAQPREARTISTDRIQ